MTTKRRTGRPPVEITPAMRKAITRAVKADQAATKANQTAVDAILAAVDAGVPVRTLSAEVGPSERTIRSWIADRRQNGT